MTPLINKDALVRVRAEGGKGWVKGTVRIASENGRSLAVSIEKSLGLGTGLSMHPDWGLMALLLASGAAWLEIQSGAHCDVEPICHCGEPLHYSDPVIRHMTERLIIDKGETVKVTVDDRSWKVPRHYIALHGLKGRDVAALGFEEVLGGEATT